MKIIARISTDFSSKFGVPRQSGLIEGIKGKIIFEEEFRNPEAFRGLEEFSHIWILWQFSEAVRDKWSPTVRPPLLGGNKRVGVFATRSPFRPNSIGLSSVRLDRVEFTETHGPVLHVSGCDLMDGTPVYDIKPYLAYTDSHPEALGGFTERTSDRSVRVEISDEFLLLIPSEKRQTLIDVLSSDPRPSYQNDPERIYGFVYSGFEVKFTVSEGVLKVASVELSE